MLAKMLPCTEVSAMDSDEARRLLNEAASVHAAAKAALDEARAQLHQVIQKVGVGKPPALRQVEIVGVTGYTRETIRTIVAEGARLEERR